MKANQNLTTIELIEKFDNQLLDILAADLRAAKFSKHQVIDQINYKESGERYPLAS